MEANNTDEQVEAARKQEIIDLKERITELETQINDSVSISGLKRFWNRITDRNIRVEARKEYLAKKSRINQISNSYPDTPANAKDKWWKIEAKRGMFNWLPF